MALPEDLLVFTDDLEGIDELLQELEELEDLAPKVETAPTTIALPMPTPVPVSKKRPRDDPPLSVAKCPRVVALPDWSIGPDLVQQRAIHNDMAADFAMTVVTKSFPTFRTIPAIPAPPPPAWFPYDISSASPYPFIDL